MEAKVVQWNLAGVNQNAFEFEVFPDGELSDFEKLRDQVNNEVAHLSAASGKDKANNVTRKARELQIAEEKATAMVQSTSKLGKLMRHHLETTYKDPTVADMFTDARNGSAVFSAPSLKSGDGNWSFISMTPNNSPKFLEHCDNKPQIIQKFWEKWEKMLRGATKVQGMADDDIAKEFAPLAVFDGTVRHIATHFRAQRQPRALEKLPGLASDYIRGMGTSFDSKACSISVAMTWIVTKVQPDVMALQEVNMLWRDSAVTQGVWKKKVGAKYLMFEPFEVQNNQQVTQLFIRKDGLFKNCVDDDLTKKANSILGDARGDSEFHTELNTQLAEELSRTMEAGKVDKAMKEQRKLMQTELKNKIAVAVVVKNGCKMLLTSVHAKSSGVNNRGIVMACQLLASKMQCKLILCIDANCSGTVAQKHVDNGAAVQDQFIKFVAAQPSMLYSKFEPRYTTFKSRTFLQTQQRKAEVIDQSWKDFVLLQNFGPKTSIKGIMVNKTNSNKTKALPNKQTNEFYQSEVRMPNPQFPSDHALIIGLCQLDPK